MGNSRLQDCGWSMKTFIRSALSLFAGILLLACTVGADQQSPVTWQEIADRSDGLLALLDKSPAVDALRAEIRGFGELAMAYDRTDDLKAAAVIAYSLLLHSIGDTSEGAAVVATTLAHFPDLKRRYRPRFDYYDQALPLTSSYGLIRREAVDTTRSTALALGDPVGFEAQRVRMRISRGTLTDEDVVAFRATIAANPASTSTATARKAEAEAVGTLLAAAVKTTEKTLPQTFTDVKTGLAVLVNVENALRNLQATLDRYPDALNYVEAKTVLEATQVDYNRKKDLVREFISRDAIAAKKAKLAAEEAERVRQDEEGEAQFQLGLKYSEGRGVPTNHVEAMKWYLKAAAHNSAKAQNGLGRMYFHGQGVKQDYSEAMKWFRKAADQGLAKAQSSVGSMYCYGQGVKRDYAEAVKWYSKAAGQGFTPAQCSLAIMYDEGQGVLQDATTAVKWLRKAADGEGDNFYRPLAQCYLGYLYAKGRGVAQSYSEAAQLYRKAAEGGSSIVQGALGNAYRHGQGVPRDNTEAAVWYRKAAEQGNANAQGVLGALYATGEGVPLEYGEAVKWLRKAATQGDANAQFNLGAMYANGTGVLKDNAQALGWLIVAAAHGQKMAVERSVRLMQVLTADQLTEAEAMARHLAPSVCDRSETTFLPRVPTRPCDPQVESDRGTSVEGSESRPSPSSGQSASTGAVFYSADREQPYWACQNSHHNTRSDAIKALAEQFDRSPTWVEQYMGAENTLIAIHASLVRRRSMEDGRSLNPTQTEAIGPQLATDDQVNAVVRDVNAKRDTLSSSLTLESIDAIMAGKSLSEQQVAAGAIYATIKMNGALSEPAKQAAIRYMINRGSLGEMFAE